MKQKKIELSRVIFWDVDYDSINWEKNARYVITRVVMYGTVEDWRAIQSFYGRERIRDEMLEERSLDPKSLSFLSCIYEIPKTKFKCYKQIRLNPGHWVYEFNEIK